MSEGPHPTESEFRFDLLQMLEEIKAETAAQQADGPVKTQSEIEKMFQGRKPRDKDG